MEISEREYKELVKIAKDNPEEKFSFVKLIKGKLNNKFLAFCITSGIIIWIIQEEHIIELDNVSRYIVFGVWGIAVMIYMLNGAIDTMVSKGELKMQANLGLQKNITETLTNFLGGKKDGNN